MDGIAQLLTDPAAWAALVTLVVMEVVLGIDNLVFISILSNKLPEESRQKVRRLGIGLALIMRLVLLSTIAWIVGLTQPAITLFDHAFSWKDLILIGGGLFLMWKATKEIHHTVDPATENGGVLDKTDVVISNVGAAVFQIVLLDIVFSVDSILTAIGMTEHLPIMALGFLLMIGMVLIADGFGMHVPKGYIYAAMAFSAGVEALNMWSRARAAKRNKSPEETLH